ncbi:MAG: hypothetical protein COA79_15950 [Planctomycetota bacterium]|nr:MAG: hypothetical protein COA79_15950 [Planctomycetota bacterium]
MRANYNLAKLLIIFFFLNGCVMFQPLKRVKIIDTKNKLLINYANNFKYLGKIPLSIPSVLSLHQKEYLHGKGYSNYDDMDDDKVYSTYIKKYKYFDMPEHLNTKELYLRLIEDGQNKHGIHIFHIRRVSGGLVTFDEILSVVEIDDKLQMVFLNLRYRTDLKKTLTNKIFLFPMNSYMFLGDCFVSTDSELFLNKLFEIQMKIKKDKSNYQLKVKRSKLVSNYWPPDVLRKIK